MIALILQQVHNLLRLLRLYLERVVTLNLALFINFDLVDIFDRNSPHSDSSEQNRLHSNNRLTIFTIGSDSHKCLFGDIQC